MRLWAVPLLALLASCTDDRGINRTNPGCSIGASRACTCADGRTGTQTCVGARFEACACQGPIPDPDAGVEPTDAGVGPDDAGEHTPQDAGFVDAGAPFDAGFPDSGVPRDAGFPDSGVLPDAGFPDSGVVPDAGFPDSGVPRDAGFPDSGVSPDGGTGPCLSNRDCPIFANCLAGQCVSCEPLTPGCGEICTDDGQCQQGELCHYVLFGFPIGVCGRSCFGATGFTCPSGTTCSASGRCQ